MTVLLNSFSRQNSAYRSGCYISFLFSDSVGGSETAIANPADFAFCSAKRFCFQFVRAAE